MLIVTAYDQGFSRVGDLCAESLRRYCAKFPHHKNQVWMIPDGWDRGASWYKVDLLKNLLTYGETVLWVDADALLVGTRDLDAVVHDATLNIAKDDNGINCGVMAWRPSRTSIQALQRMDDGYGRFRDHPWAEQNVLMEFVDELDVFYQPKPVWNAYPEEVDGGGDVGDETMIIHWPGMSIEERLPYMQEIAGT